MHLQDEETSVDLERDAVTIYEVVYLRSPREETERSCACMRACVRDRERGSETETVKAGLTFSLRELVNA